MALCLAVGTTMSAIVALDVDCHMCGFIRISSAIAIRHEDVTASGFHVLPFAVVLEAIGTDETLIIFCSP